MKVTQRVKPPAYSYDPREDGVSQSMLQAFQSCKQLAWLQTVKGWRPRGASKPLIHGDISHRAIEHELMAVQQGSIIEVGQLVNMVRPALEVAHTGWCDANPDADTEARDIAEEAHAILLQLLPRYWKRWGKDDLAAKWRHIETQFKVPLEVEPGVTIPLVGKFDGVMEGRKPGRPRLFETKNKSMWSEQLVDLLPMDLQLGTYITALELLSGETPGTVTYNILRRPGERRKKDESLAEFASRIGKRADMEPEHYFVRFTMELTRDERERHKKRVFGLVREFWQWWLEAREFMNGDVRWNSYQCESKYGVCPFLRWCAHGDKAPYTVLRSPHPELA